MIKFHDVTDLQQFMLEVGVNPTSVMNIKCLEDYTPSQELIELFYKRRRSIVGKLKDFRRSQSAKEAWRHNRRSFIKGIRSFHKSTAGKRHHRALSRFLNTRESRPSMFRENLEHLDMELLKALSSFETHMYIEKGYYHPIDEQISFEIFFENDVPDLLTMRMDLLSGKNLTESQLQLLLDITNEKEIFEEMGRPDLSEKYSQQLTLSEFNEMKYNK